MAKQQPKQSGTVTRVSHGAKSTDRFAQGRVQDTYNTKTRVRWFDSRTERNFSTLT